MEKYFIENDIKVFGKEVTSFPNGIGEVFEELMKMLDDKRSYYGISYFDEKGNIKYFATAEEIIAGEADKFSLQKFTIEKGAYLSEKIIDWQKNLHCIKDVFHELMQSANADTAKPCIEWYKTDKEMFCMIKHK